MLIFANAKCENRKTIDNMKKFFVAMLLLAGTLTATAQTATPTNGLKGYVTNGFWANWEISAGAGFNYYHWGYGSHGKIGWEVNASATKWVIPALGVRVQLQGGEHNYRLSPTADASQSYIGLHGDLMVNVSNWVRYREDRFYSFIPFMGFGLMSTDPGNDNTYNNLGAYAGILNKFRVGKSIDLNLELKTYASKREKEVFRKALSVTAGVTYRFNKRDWDRVPQPVDVSGYVKQIKALKGDVAAARDAAADAKNAAAEAAKEAEAARRALANVKPVYVDGQSSLVFFPIGQSKLTEQDKLRLDQFVAQIKNGNPDKVYTIEGHADSATGSARVNQRLSEARAKSVYDYFVSQGIDANRLEIKACGDKESPYGKPANDRVAIVKK